jgi:hypothetical protein
VHTMEPPNSVKFFSPKKEDSFSASYLNRFLKPAPSTPAGFFHSRTCEP